MTDGQGRSMNRRPKLGMALLSAEWFYRRGPDGAAPESGRQLAVIVRRDVDELVARVSKFAEPVYPQLITTAAQAEEAAATYQRAGIDGLLICSMTWSEDAPLLRILEATPGTPTLIWCFCGLPGAMSEPLGLVDLFHGSGPVGSLQSSGLLRRLGRGGPVVVGRYESPEVLSRVEDFARAAACAAELPRVRIGVLPHRCEVMSSTWVDEIALRDQIGPALVPITSSAYERVCEATPSSEIDTFLAWIRNTYTVRSQTEASLEKSARASIALAEVFRRFDLDALAYDDTNEELLSRVGVRAGLCVPELFARGGVVSMEADVGAATTLLILRALTGKPPMYTEIQNYDLEENGVLLSHSGMHDYRLASDPNAITIVPDPELVEACELPGAFGEYRVKSGPIAMVNFVQAPEGFRMTVTRADALDGPVRLAGFPHLWARMATALPTFFERAIERGVTQHWNVVHDPGVTARLEILSRIVGFDIEII